MTDNENDYAYNKETMIIFKKPDQNKKTSQFNIKQQIKSLRKTEFKRYNRFFEREMNKTVQNNNREIYQKCIHFVKQHCIKFFSKDVPCNVVITNCESSSNNETQFNSLFEALKKEQILNFVIDEKKCGTTKNMISYIQKAVGEVVGEASLDSRAGIHESDEEVKVVVSSDEESSQGEDSEPDLPVEEERNEMHSISPRKGPTTDEYPNPVLGDKNEEAFRAKNSTMSDLSHKRHRYNDVVMEDEEDSREKVHAPGYDTSATDKIGFAGVKKIIKNSRCKSPIVIVIQNIKTFPTDNLNDLIYLVKKYRAKHKLKLCLMLGVQSNSYEDLMSKISITTSNFMIVKKFYFPSMKRILLEVIYRLLKSDRNIYLFGHNFLKTVIQNIQVYGLSLEKFKRIMHYLLASCFHHNEYFYVNALIDKHAETIDKEQLVDQDDDSQNSFFFNDLIQKFSKQNKCLEDLDQCLQSTSQIYNDSLTDMKSEADFKNMLCKFYRAKIKYFKAYEVMEELCVQCMEENSSQQDIQVFKHCFLLNLFACNKDRDKFHVIYDELQNTNDYSLLLDWIEAHLAKKKSNFLREEGEYLAYQKLTFGEKMNKSFTGGNSKRMQKLTENSFGEPKAAQFSLSNEDCKEILKTWLLEFIEKHLNLGDILDDKIMSKLFILDASDISQKISPDIQGNMTESLMNSGKKLTEMVRITSESKGEELDAETLRRYEILLEKDTTKLMDNYKNHGKDIDVNEWFKEFKKQLGLNSKNNDPKITERFLRALGDLKFMGYISESGRGTYIFKRNYFGKNKTVMEETNIKKTNDRKK